MPTRPSPQTERVVELFDLLAADDGPGLTLAEVSRRLGVHKASCHSMLTELLRAGWVLRDPARKRYQLGPALVRLGTAAASRFPALDMARSAMGELSHATGAHCIAFSIGADHVTVVDQVRSPRSAGHPMPVGTELPVQAPYGAALASWMPTDAQERWLSSIPPGAQSRYREALANTRRRGYAVGLHVLADVRLQELAAVTRAAESRKGRLGDLAQSLTEELLMSEEWFPVSLNPRRSYDVSHIDSPVLGADGSPVLILSLVPVPSRIAGMEVASMGEVLARRARQLSSALAAPQLAR